MSPSEVSKRVRAEQRLQHLMSIAERHYPRELGYRHVPRMEDAEDVRCVVGIYKKIPDAQREAGYDLQFERFIHDVNEGVTDDR